MVVRLHDGDLPAGYDPGKSIAIDTETLGLRRGRDRLCLVQFSTGDGNADLVRVAPGQTEAPHISAILSNPDVLKIFHFARFDVAVLYEAFNVVTAPIYCTKIASVFARTFTSSHSLRDLCRDLLGVKINKQEQCSDWGAADLTDAQLEYAASDVLHLHKLREILDTALAREGRREYAARCFEFVPWRAQIDLAGWDNVDLFAYNAGARE